MSRLGVLTGGGDCPGLNAALRGLVARAQRGHQAEVVGILDGWDGLMEGRTRPLDRDAAATRTSTARVARRSRRRSTVRASTPSW